MPELPEVQTTVDGLNKTVKGRKIVDIWTDYKSSFHKGADNIKDPKFFAKFKHAIKGTKILRAERRAKNILIHLSNDKTILVHMKMTGHFVYDPKPDYPFVHLAFILNNKKKLVFSDLRKFAKVTLIDTKDLPHSSHLSHLGPEPLGKDFSYQIFKSRLSKRPKGKVKQVLMDQSLIAGIGNIYSDEILWLSNVHPLSLTGKIPEKNMKLMYKAMKDTLKKGVRLGGDSTSDYRNIEGAPGEFQANHNAYQMHKKKCRKRGCPGVLEKIIVGGRSAHFCPVHQRLYR